MHDCCVFNALWLAVRRGSHLSIQPLTQIPEALRRHIGAIVIKPDRQSRLNIIRRKAQSLSGGAKRTHVLLMF